AHELAHIRRWDLWVTLVQRVAETLLFYHPAVWWISRLLDQEREMCCDELAVAATGERLVYVQTLATVARVPLVPAPAILAASFGGERKMYLLNRVRNVLERPWAEAQGRWWPVGALALMIPAALAWTSLSNSSSPTTARADEREGAAGER